MQQAHTLLARRFASCNWLNDCLVLLILFLNRFERLKGEEPWGYACDVQAPPCGSTGTDLSRLRELSWGISTDVACSWTPFAAFLPFLLVLLRSSSYIAIKVLSNCNEFLWPFRYSRPPCGRNSSLWSASNGPLLLQSSPWHAALQPAWNDKYCSPWCPRP